uniref:Uncharacterized protein n=1 Tax=Acrobeloides nanus TaxID=290746 RepID=A0A914E4W7_9BILA
MMIFLEAFKTNPFFDVANTIFVISILICIYGCEVLKKISQQKLSVYYFGSLYMVVNITQAIFTAPKVLFDTLLRYGAIEVGALNTPESRSQFLANFAYICQALLLAIFSFFILNPSKNALFDEYSTRRRESVNNMPEQSHLTRRNP